MRKWNISRMRLIIKGFLFYLSYNYILLYTYFICITYLFIVNKQNQYNSFIQSMRFIINDNCVNVRRLESLEEWRVFFFNIELLKACTMDWGTIEECIDKRSIAIIVSIR